jgi:hypothetical protein
MTNTDLYGKPLSAAPEFKLSKWQKRQAALLYHFASIDRLKELKKVLDDFVNGVDINLDAAKSQGRDELIANPQWGVRDTAANFSTYGFPALKDFQKTTSKQVAQRVNEYYEFTGYNQCGRLLGELSMGWSTPDEEEHFNAGMKVIGKQANWIDTTMQHAFSDDIFSVAWDEHSHNFPKLPKFRVRTDVQGESGKMPVRTGVYVSQDDPYGSLQFAWTGNSDGRLFDCSTFNDLGLLALHTVGRDALWTDDPRLLAIAKLPKYIEAFKELDWFKEPDFLNDITRAMPFISGAGITSRPCKWYFVEIVNGEFEDLDESASEIQSPADRVRLQAGQKCTTTGYYFTPAQTNSRRLFKQGDTMPSLGGDYGLTIWQWDEHQS